MTMFVYIFSAELTAYARHREQGGDWFWPVCATFCVVGGYEQMFHGERVSIGEI
jgi:hypothetical protein